MQQLTIAAILLSSIVSFTRTRSAATINQGGHQRLPFAYCMSLSTEIDSQLPLEKFVRSSIIERLDEHTRHGAFLALGCHAGPFIPVRTVGLPSRCKFIHQLWWAIWREGSNWPKQFQLQGPQHVQGPIGLLQSEAHPRLLTNGQPGCRSISELPH